MVEISVIVPVYKVQRYLTDCVESILNQTFKEFELILIDDGSPDKCGEMCDIFAEKDLRIKVIHKKNGGLSSARNAGIELAKGRLLCFVDSDDLIHPQFLEYLYECQVKNNADIVSTRYNTFKGRPIEYYPIKKYTYNVLNKSDFLNNLYPENFEKIGVSAWGKLYKRELFNEIKYPVGKIYEDLHIYLKLLEKSEVIVIVPINMYYYNIGNESITKSNYLKYNRFDEFCVRLEHVKYFEKREMKEQADYALNDYLTFFLKNAFAVLVFYPEIKKELRPYMKQNRKMLKKILWNMKICKMRKIVLILLHISPKLSFLIARKYLPDCVGIVE